MIFAGQDTTLNVVREQPKALRRSEVETFELIPAEDGGGVDVVRRKTLTTTYSLTNNSKKLQPRILVDHFASPKDGGYSITTTERQVKSAVGFGYMRRSL